MNSTMASSGCHELHSRLYEDMPRFLSRKNIVIICRDGRYRSVANAEMWSVTLARYGQSRHSNSLLHLAELDFWQNTCGGKFPGCIKRTTSTLQIHCGCFQAECLRLATSSNSSNSKSMQRKRTRQEISGQRQAEEKMSSKTTRAVDRRGKPSTEPENPVELAERLE